MTSSIGIAMGMASDAPPADPPNASRAMQSNLYEREDEYSRFYTGGVNNRGVIEPPYVLRVLDRLSQENNALSPCIEAMVTNIEGTGFVFEPVHGNTTDAVELIATQELVDFFDEPWPGVSFKEMRQNVRRDIERTGNGYFEVIRNAADVIMFMRVADSKMVRCIKLDDSTVVTKTVIRRGQAVRVKISVRERRFVQILNGRTLVYFKDFGSRRDLNKVTGVWAKPGERLPANLRASELLHLTALPDAHTPYGVPRWASQLPSVLGSRKAEEFNLDFFDNGGVPPIMILLQGGVLAPETRNAINLGLTQGAKRANRVQVIEAEPTGGSLDSASNARITVERFGHERQNDSMFEKYDDKCELRVRRAFRLPSIFVGTTHDYSFATAYASYTVAEAQVFRPERDKIDEMITLRVLPEMGYSGYRMRSHNMHINDVTAQLTGITLANSTNYVAQSEVITAVNAVCGLKLRVSDGPVLPWLVPGTNPNSGLPLRGAEAASKVQPTPLPGPPSPVGKGVTSSPKGSSSGTPHQPPRATPSRTATTSTKSDATDDEDTLVDAALEVGTFAAGGTYADSLKTGVRKLRDKAKDTH